MSRPLGTPRNLSSRSGWPDCLPVVCVSHAWLSAEHPDPRGSTLASLAGALRPLVERRGRHGVLLDYCSIHQRCRDAAGAATSACFGSDHGSVVGLYASEEVLRA